MTTGATWPIRLNRPHTAAMPPFCQIPLTTCYYCYHFAEDKMSTYTVASASASKTTLHRHCFRW